MCFSYKVAYFYIAKTKSCYNVNYLACSFMCRRICRQIFKSVLAFLLQKHHQRCSIKNVFLKILQNSKEKTCARVSFLKEFEAWDLHFYQKRDSDTGIFLRILLIFFLRNTPGRLLLLLSTISNNKQTFMEKSLSCFHILSTK